MKGLEGPSCTALERIENVITGAPIPGQFFFSLWDSRCVELCPCEAAVIQKPSVSVVSLWPETAYGTFLTPAYQCLLFLGFPLGEKVGTEGQ